LKKTDSQFLRGEVASGLRFHDFSISPTLYYALKHRESNMEISLGGPTDRLGVAKSVIGPEQLSLPQQTSATVSEDFLARALKPNPGRMTRTALWRW
jgi:hypothetical protein